ncbi:lysoplasmalogenase [soil metagenome]
MKKTSAFLIFFLMVSLIQLFAVATNFHLIANISKPFIMLSLIGYYWITAERRSVLFVFALLFCWAGDILLIFQSSAELFFIFGLVAFLIGHSLYMISYNQFRWSNTKNELLWTQKIRMSFPIILAGTGLITVLFPALGSLKIPVLVYALVLVAMVMTALFRYGRTSPESFWKVFIGAVLFMTSDSLLAINKFHTALPYAGLLIMLTYIVAQYIIVEGVIKHRE